MTHERITALLSAYPCRRVAVFGDYFLDRYLDFDPELAEISLETGKTANQVVSVRHSPGAAGSVVCNLRALGCGSISVIGFCGDDGEGYELRQDLDAIACRREHLLVVPELRTPVYCKPRNIRVPGLEGESERLDTRNWYALPTSIEDRLIASLDATVGEVDAVIVIDQVSQENCGAVTARVRAHLCEVAAQYREKVFWVDSRYRTGKYSNLIIKCNQREAVPAAYPNRSNGSDDELVMQAGRKLSHRSGRPVFVTRGERGIAVFDGDAVEPVRGVRVDGPVDPTGAGDSATAAAVLTLAGAGSLVEAALIANLAASITVQQLGTTGTATPDQAIERLGVWHEQGGTRG